MIGYPKHFTDHAGYRWYCDEDLTVHPEQEGGYTLECGCTISEPLWIAPDGDMISNNAVTNYQMHMQNDPTWQEVQKSPYSEEQKQEIYRIAHAIEVRVRSVYPELHEIGDRPHAWVYPATILLGMVEPPQDAT